MQQPFKIFYYKYQISLIIVQNLSRFRTFYYTFIIYKFFISRFDIYYFESPNFFQYQLDICYFKLVNLLFISKYSILVNRDNNNNLFLLYLFLSLYTASSRFQNIFLYTSYFLRQTYRGGLFRPATCLQLLFYILFYQVRQILLLSLQLQIAISLLTNIQVIIFILQISENYIFFQLYIYNIEYYLDNLPYYLNIEQFYFLLYLL